MLNIDLIEEPSNKRPAGASKRAVHIPGGVLGFTPAYFNSETGEMMLSAFANGSPAPIHLLEGLPAAWLTAQAGTGSPATIKDSVISGYSRDNTFFTREQAKALAEQENVDRASGSAYYDAF